MKVKKPRDVDVLGVKGSLALLGLEAVKMKG